jgi:hypothetical protein
MTRARTTDRASGRGVQTLATLRPALMVTACVALLVALVVACGPSGPTATPGSSSPAPASPTGSGAPSADGSGAARPTPWPGNSVLGIEALGVADGQITAATNDLSRGIAEEDLALIRQAADGLAGLDVLLPNMERIRLNEAMRPFADQYEAAITATDDAATRLRDAIDAGDAAAITTSTQDLLDGLAAYTAVQGELAMWVAQIPDQKRLLVN